MVHHKSGTIVLGNKGRRILIIHYIWNFSSHIAGKKFERDGEEEKEYSLVPLFSPLGLRIMQLLDG